MFKSKWNLSIAALKEVGKESNGLEDMEVTEKLVDLEWAVPAVCIKKKTK